MFLCSGHDTTGPEGPTHVYEAPCDSTRPLSVVVIVSGHESNSSEILNLDPAPSDYPPAPPDDSENFESYVSGPPTDMSTPPRQTSSRCRLPSNSLYERPPVYDPPPRDEAPIIVNKKRHASIFNKLKRRRLVNQ